MSSLTETRWADCLFIVIPGIGGSILERRVNGVAQPVWGTMSKAAHRVVSPLVLETSDLDGVEPVGVIDDWCVLRKFVVVAGYGGLVRKIMNVSKLTVDWGDPADRRLDAQVVVFPWDFRRSIEHAADRLDRQVSERLACIFGPQANFDRRVVIVAHSMGGQTKPSSSRPTTCTRKPVTLRSAAPVTRRASTLSLTTSTTTRASTSRTGPLLDHGPRRSPTSTAGSPGPSRISSRRMLPEETQRAATSDDRVERGHDPKLSVR